MTPDVVVVGGGPAGLAAAIGFAAAHVPTLLVERHQFPIDKPCGEGLLPNGVAALDRLGLSRAALLRAGHPISGIRYESARGRVADAAFAGEPGLALRRVCLSAMLVARARELPALTLRASANADVRVVDGRPVVVIGAETIAPRLVVGADGLTSRVRHAIGARDTARRARRARRWGVRQHFDGAPWTDRVEVYFERGLEAYVTPLADGINVAWLWELEAGAVTPGSAVVPSLVSSVPRLAPRLSGRRPVGRPLAAGPFCRRPDRRATNGLVLIGDAAGYVDPLTGEGVGLGLSHAEILVRTIAPRLASSPGGADTVPARDLARALRAIDAACRPNRQLTRFLLGLASHPVLVERVVAALGSDPALFAHGLDVNMGRRSAWRLPLASVLRLPWSFGFGGNKPVRPRYHEGRGVP